MWNPFEIKSYFKALIFERNFFQEWNFHKFAAYFSIEWELLSDSHIPVDVEKLVNSIVCDHAIYNQGLKLVSAALASILAELMQVQCTNNIFELSFIL